MVPTVDDEFKPKLKRVFDSLDEGYTFYNNYALAARFEIQKHGSKKSSDGDCLVIKNLFAAKKAKRGWMLFLNLIGNVGREILELTTRQNLRFIRELVVKSLLTVFNK